MDAHDETRAQLRSLQHDFNLYTEYVTARIQGLTHQLAATKNQHAKTAERIKQLEAQLDALTSIQN